MPHLPPGSPPVRRAPPPADRLTCDDALAQIEPHLDGDLAVAAAERLAAHLEDCPGCAAELRLAAEIRHELRSLPELDCPPHVLARVTAEARQTIGGRRRRLPWRPRSAKPWSRAAAAWRAALAAGVVAALLVGGAAWHALHRAPAAQAEPSRQQTARAAREARFALAYIDRVSRRAALELRDQVLARHLVLPAARGLSRSLAATLDRAAHASPRSGAGPGPAGAVRERS